MSGFGRGLKPLVSLFLKAFQHQSRCFALTAAMFVAEEFSTSLPLSDIEQAPHSQVGSPNSPNAPADKVTQPPGRHTIRHTADSTKNVEVDKVIVLSFRNLQLRRIADLQDKLLRLAAVNEHGIEATTLSNHKNLVDKALRDYGM